ncbi:MAG TPA: HIT domain-containing protein [Thermoanaerobaculia bacterium]|jgi:ATP adenylyltransferase|nr:HIT domain-containing protein [Thermoanaerobaculia bacterium]
MEVLFTPWRFAYVEGARESDTGCFFCDAAAAPDDPERLVVHAASHHLVLLNRHPYSNGHLMVAPRQHLASPHDASPAAQAEVWPLLLLCQRVLGAAYRPNGMNLGMNLGKVAGAGVPDHYHVHLVPRWEGDTNFMTAIADTRLVPEDLLQTRERLRPLFAQLAVAEAAS